jgi:hypothetical protein
VRRLRAQLPTGKLVTITSQADSPVDPGALALDAITRSGSQQHTIDALVRDLFPGAFPSLIDCSRRPIYHPDITCGSCGDPDPTHEELAGWAFWYPNSDPIVDWVNLVSHVAPSGRRTTSELLDSWEGYSGRAHSLSVGDSVGWVGREFFIVGREGDHELLDRPVSDHDNFISWDNLIKQCTPELHNFGAPAPSVLVIDELISSARRILTLLARDPLILTALDARRFEEATAIMFSDLGFEIVELTRTGKDAGRDIILRQTDALTGTIHTVLVECKHWTSGKLVGVDIALQLLDVLKREDSTAPQALLLATGGFGPTLVEICAQLQTQHLHLRDRQDFFRWLSAWERTFASPILRPIGVRELLGLD